MGRPGRGRRGVGARLELDLRWRGERLDWLLDESHAAIVDAIVALLTRCGWETAVEVSFSLFGERGSIDVLGRHKATGIVAVIEAKASIADVNQTVMTLDRKARLAPAIAEARAWDCRAVARFLVIRDGSTSRDRVARHEVTFAAAFPLRGRACTRWLREPTVPPPSGLFFLNLRDSRVTGIARRRVSAPNQASERPRTSRPREPPR